MFGLLVPLSSSSIIPNDSSKRAGLYVAFYLKKSSFEYYVCAVSNISSGRPRKCVKSSFVRDLISLLREAFYVAIFANGVWLCIVRENNSVIADD